MIKDVLRLKLHGKLSHEAIARSLSVSKGVVAKYASLATAGCLQDWASVAALSEAELERRLFPPASPASSGEPMSIDSLRR